MADALYRPHGPGHRALARLAEGPAGRHELIRAAEPRRGARRRRASGGLVFALRDGGLALTVERGAYVITRAGADALACLDAGHPVRVTMAGVATFGEAVGS